MNYATLAMKREAAPAQRGTASKVAPSALRIGKPAAASEQEAVRLADAIVHEGSARPQWSFSRLSATPPLQRKCASGRSAREGGECGECSKEGLHRASRAPGKTGRQDHGEAPPIVHEALRSPGEPLDAAPRAFMESRFKHDFSRVRVHRDAKAAASARAVNALAYTVGSDVVFGSGQPPFGSSAGQELLAHELAHVVQQKRTEALGNEQLRVEAADTPAEREATMFSGSALDDESAPASRPSPRAHGRSLQRQLKDGDVESGGDKGALLWESFKQSVTLDRFDLDKAALKPEHIEKLKEFKDRFRTLLGRHADSYISVIGHTDATGTEQHNEALGQARADAVTTELTSGDNALPAEIVHTGSLGESMLAVPAKGPEPRNRRVDILPTLRRAFKAQLSPPQQPTPPSPDKPIETDFCKRNPDLCLKQKFPPSDGASLPPDLFKPLPPAPKKTQKSALDLINESPVDPIVKKVTKGLGLSKDIQKMALDLAHDGVEKGISSGLKAALGAAGVDGAGQEAIEKAVDAAIKEKSQKTEQP